jgi:leucyl aminopeptidase (aminopeptidase T)
MRYVELAKAAKTVVEGCLGVRSGEQVAIVADSRRPAAVAEALAAAVAAADADPVLAYFAARERSPSEPPSGVAAAIREADAAVLYTTASLTHSRARLEAQAAGTRVISAPGVSEESFLRTLAVDIPTLAEQTNRLAAVVATAQHVRIRTALGTDVELDLAHPVVSADGWCREAGELDFIAPGLVLSVPVEGSVRGVAVVDAAATYLGRLADPLTIQFREGRATQISGGPSAGRFRRMLEALDDSNVFAFAAWGMGTNPRAQLLGDDPSFEGERIFGWAHLSTGSNAALPGGTIRARLHVDLILADPIVELDGRVVLQDRQFSLPS